MSRDTSGRSRSAIGFGVAMALYGSAGFGQDSIGAGASENIEIIVVTGSFIRGAAEDAALPIDILSAEDLQKQGSPTMVELIKALPSSQGVMGDSNQFSAGQSTGSANINLRGLGASRTLVLLNGRRVAPNPAVGVGVDINLFPTAAIGRIEILKDGAAATYGSDAMAGVVNFITKTDLEGLQIDGSYSYVDGSDGDYSTNLAYGWQTENTDVLVTAGYRHRSELPVRERDWALRPYAENPQGGWSGLSNPGAFVAGAGFATRVVDPQCENLGGVFTGTAGGRSGSPVSAAAATGCSFQYLAFDNLVEDEDHYQIFGQLNQKLGESMNLNFEALYASHEVKAENSSPSYGPNQGASGGAPSYFVPISNPGFAAWLPQLSSGQQAAIAASGGVVASGLLWRPFGVGGNPLTGGGKEDERLFDMYRFSIGLDGQIGDNLTWDTAVTYGATIADVSTPDILVARLGRALVGLGGPNCSGTTPGAGGCLWLNPFSTAVTQNAVTGQQNTAGAPVPNNVELAEWLFEDYGYELTQTVLTVDAGLTGETGIKLPGGNIAWAIGGQYRENGYKRDANDFSDPGVSPCPQSPINPAATCAVQSGAFAFFGPLAYYDLKQDVFSVYTELNLPILESLNAQVAVRYEDYGGGIGDSTNPKLALRWQPLDALSFRGSVGTTFRAPPATQTVPGLALTASAFTAQAGGYKPYDTFGNPDLGPETALTFNVGMMISIGGFSGSLDYWSFNIEDEISNEPGTDLVRAFFNGQLNCGNPALAGVQARFSFTGTGCGNPAAANPNVPVIGNLVRTRVGPYNSASDVDVSGIDASLRYEFEQVLGGDLVVGTDGTYNLKYEQGPTVVEGVVLQEAGDFVGTRGIAGSIAEWKISAFAEYAAGNHNVRWTTRYMSSMDDTRVGQALTTFAGIAAGDPGSTVGSFTVHDLNYRLLLPAETVLSASVTNVFDKDPPFARLDLSYDPFSGSPIGRVFKVGFTKTF